MSDSDWSVKPRLIGDIERGDHAHLEADDRCLYFGEYTSRAGFEHGETNNLISNLQKPVTRQGKPDYRYKEVAIRRIAAAIRTASGKAARGEVILVPAPPSKPRDHAEYDDRMEKIARAVSNEANVRCLLETVAPREQAKRADHRPSIDELVQSMRVVTDLLPKDPGGIILLDDVITNGTTFKAAQRLLRPHFPGVKMVGLFVARRVLPAIAWGDEDS